MSTSHFSQCQFALPEMLHCISGIVGLQLNILLICIKLVGRIAYYHRGHIALKHRLDWNIPMSEFHLATIFVSPFQPALNIETVDLKIYPSFLFLHLNHPLQHPAFSAHILYPKHPFQHISDLNTILKYYSLGPRMC